MNYPKYKSIDFIAYLETANEILNIIKNLSNFSIHLHMNMYEDMIIIIENQIIKSKNQNDFNDKCQKMTKQIGILTNAIQFLNKFI